MSFPSLSLIEIYRIAYVYLRRMGFTDWQAQRLAALRVGYQNYPEAFM